MDLPMVANDMGYRIDLTINKKSSECMKETVNPTIINIRSDMKGLDFLLPYQPIVKSSRRINFCHLVGTMATGTTNENGVGESRLFKLRDHTIKPLIALKQFRSRHGDMFQPSKSPSILGTTSP